MKSKQLVFAREYRGLTQKALAAAINGLSQSNLSKYEKGIESLSDENVERIMQYLKFPMNFLNLCINNDVENKHYRKRASINAASKKQIDRTISLIAYIFDWMSDFVELPDYKLGDYDLEQGIAPREVARQIRRQCKLGVEPIRNICTILEANGVFVYFWDCPYEEFDGVSLITDNGFRLIVVNKNHSNDRLRWTLAHELGHCLMHENIALFVSENRDKEKEANEFAAELLLPESETKKAFVGLTIKRLYDFKTYWLTSMGAIVQRANQLGAITNEKYKLIRIEFSRNRWNKTEPISVYLDAPTVFSKMYTLIVDSLHYSSDTMAESMGIPIDIINEIFSRPKVIQLKYHNK